MIEDGIAELLGHGPPGTTYTGAEPLHPMYAADRAAVNTLGQALDTPSGSTPADRARRWRSTLSHVVGP